MTRKKRWRYYCDFCGKSGGAGGHIASHEKGCTLNPNRECGLCRMRDRTQMPASELIAAFESHAADWTAGLAVVRELCDDCPACILAAIRQSPRLARERDEYKGEGEYPTVEFDFRTALAGFWDEIKTTEDADTWERDHAYYGI